MKENKCAIFCFCTGAYDCKHQVGTGTGDSRCCAWIGFNNRCDCIPAQIEAAKKFIEENEFYSKCDRCGEVCRKDDMSYPEFKDGEVIAVCESCIQQINSQSKENTDG